MNQVNNEKVNLNILLQFLEHSEKSIAIFDTNMRYIFANPMWMKAYGIEGQEVIGKSHYDVFPEIGETWKEHHRQVIEEGKIITNDADPFDRLDGKTDYIKYEVRPWFEDDGTTIGGVMMYTEVVTESIELQMSLFEERDRTNAMLDGLPDLMFRFDRDGIYQDAKEHPDLLAPREALIGKKITDVIEGDVGKAYLGMFQEVIDTKKSKTFEYMLDVSSGTRVYEARIVPIQAYREVMLMVRDVTERHDAQAAREDLIEQLRKANRLANENARLKSEFLATMSHELRTPMNAIEGFTSLMLNRMGKAEFNDKTERYLEKVNSNSKRLLALINDFLDLSRIESGRVELAHSPFDPKNMIDMWQEDISVLANEKKLKLEVDVSDTLPDTLYGDSESITKIAINLLSNAIKFTEAGTVTLDVTNDENDWKIIVKDTGIGIPPHAQEFIFEEFRQVDQSSKRKYGGTGLGLAIVQRLARLMQGQVTVDSEVGQGSTFTVTLPIHREPAPKL